MRIEEFTNTLDQINPNDVQKQRMCNRILNNESKVKNMKTTRRKFPKFAAYAMSVMLLLAAGSGSVWAYFTPYSYVSLDVNPSIEYSVNRFDKVIDYNAVNNDGEAILENLNLKNMSIQDAIASTVQEITDQGYLVSSQGGIVIAVSSENQNDEDKLVGELEVRIMNVAKENKLQVSIEAEGIGAERVAEAKALGVTPGKLNLVEKLQDSNPDVDIDTEEWLDKPVKDIMAQIKENREAGITDGAIDVDDDADEDKNNSNSKANPNSINKNDDAIVTDDDDADDNDDSDTNKNIQNPNSNPNALNKNADNDNIDDDDVTDDDVDDDQEIDEDTVKGQNSNNSEKNKNK